MRHHKGIVLVDALDVSKRSMTISFIFIFVKQHDYFPPDKSTSFSWLYFICGILFLVRLLGIRFVVEIILCFFTGIWRLYGSVNVKGCNLIFFDRTVRRHHYRVALDDKFQGLRRGAPGSNNGNTRLRTGSIVSDTLF